MLANRDAGVAEGVGVGVGLCADNSLAATTVNAKAKQKPIRILPQTLPMEMSGSKKVLLGKQKVCASRKILTWCALCRGETR